MYLKLVVNVPLFVCYLILHIEDKYKTKFGDRGGTVVKVLCYKSEEVAV